MSKLSVNNDGNDTTACSTEDIETVRLVLNTLDEKLLAAKDLHRRLLLIQLKRKAMKFAMKNKACERVKIRPAWFLLLIISGYAFTFIHPFDTQLLLDLINQTMTPNIPPCFGNLVKFYWMCMSTSLIWLLASPFQAGFWPPSKSRQLLYKFESIIENPSTWSSSSY